MFAITRRVDVPRQLLRRWSNYENHTPEYRSQRYGSNKPWTQVQETRVCGYGLNNINKYIAHALANEEHPAPFMFLLGGNMKMIQSTKSYGLVQFIDDNNCQVSEGFDFEIVDGYEFRKMATSYPFPSTKHYRMKTLVLDKHEHITTMTDPNQDFRHPGFRSSLYRYKRHTQFSSDQSPFLYTTKDRRRLVQSELLPRDIDPSRLRLEDNDTARASHEPIKQLIISFEPRAMCKALAAQRHRFRRDSTILIIQRGKLGIAELLNENVFTDPKTRPNYICGIFTHRITSSENTDDESFLEQSDSLDSLAGRRAQYDPARPGMKVRQKSEGRFLISPVLKHRNESAEENSERQKTAAYFTSILLDAKLLNAKLLDANKHLFIRYQEMMVASVIYPLTVQHCCYSRDILKDDERKAQFKGLLREAWAIMRKVFPDYTYEQLEHYMTGLIVREGDRYNPLLFKVINGLRTGTEWTNGYLVTFAKEQHLPCPEHVKMANFILETSQRIATLISEMYENGREKGRRGRKCPAKVTQDFTDDWHELEVALAVRNLNRAERKERGIKLEHWKKKTSPNSYFRKTHPATAQGPYTWARASRNSRERSRKIRGTESLGVSSAQTSDQLTARFDASTNFTTKGVTQIGDAGAETPQSRGSALSHAQARKEQRREQKRLKMLRCRHRRAAKARIQWTSSNVLKNPDVADIDDGEGANTSKSTNPETNSDGIRSSTVTKEEPQLYLTVILDKVPLSLVVYQKATVKLEEVNSGSPKGSKQPEEIEFPNKRDSVNDTNLPQSKQPEDIQAVPQAKNSTTQGLKPEEAAPAPDAKAAEKPRKDPLVTLRLLMSELDRRDQLREEEELQKEAQKQEELREEARKAAELRKQDELRKAVEQASPSEEKTPQQSPKFSLAKVAKPTPEPPQTKKEKVLGLDILDGTPISTQPTPIAQPQKKEEEVPKTWWAYFFGSSTIIPAKPAVVPRPAIVPKPKPVPEPKFIARPIVPGVYVKMTLERVAEAAIRRAGKGNEIFIMRKAKEKEKVEGDEKSRATGPKWTFSEMARFYLVIALMLTAVTMVPLYLSVIFIGAQSLAKPAGEGIVLLGKERGAKRSEVKDSEKTEVSGVVRSIGTSQPMREAVELGGEESGGKDSEVKEAGAEGGLGKRG